MLRDQILKASDLKLHQVEVPEWSMTIYVRKMTVGEVSSFVKETQQAIANHDEAELYALLVAKTTCDEAGKRVFTDADAEALKSKSFEAVKRVAEAAIDFNRLGGQGLEAEKKD